VEIQYSYKESKEIVMTCLKGGRTPALWGPPGIGKSSLGREVAGELGAQLYILDVPLLQPIDYQAAVPVHSTRTVEIYTTGFIPQNGPAVVLVEDLPHAKQYQQIPVMQMVLDRRIGPMKFADDVWFIITGNMEEDLAGVNPLPSPLLNRLLHIFMVADLDEWIAWGAGRIREDVLGFVRGYPEMFCQRPKDSERAWPTPRSWHIFSDVAAHARKESTIRALLNGTVGPQAAHMYLTWVKYLREVDPRKVVEGGEIPDMADRGKSFAVILSVAGHLKKSPVAYIKKNVKGIEAFFRALQGEFKMAFLKEMIPYNNGKADTRLVTALMEGVPETGRYVVDLISPGGASTKDESD